MITWTSTDQKRTYLVLCLCPRLVFVIKSSTDMSVYSVQDDFTHIKTHMGMWLGKSETVSEKTYGYDYKSDTLTYEKRTYNHGFMKIYDEILVNAIDNYQRSRGMTYIKVDVVDNLISIENDGPSIPIQRYQVHPRRPDETDVSYQRRYEAEKLQEGKYIPEVIFTALRSSSNYDDANRTTGGLNGVGAKLTVLFSQLFSIDIINNGTRYEQTIRNNLEVIETPKTTLTLSPDHVRISFSPDWSKLDSTQTVANHLPMIAKRLFDYSHLDLDLMFNGIKLPRLSWRDFSFKHLSLHSNLEIYEEQRTVGDTSWKICYGYSPNKTDVISYVNNVCTYKGGPHVDLIRRQITAEVKAKSKRDVNTNSVNAHIGMTVYAIIPGVSFEAQSKTSLASSKIKYPILTQVEEFVKNSGILTYDQPKQHVKTVQRSRITDIEKLHDAEEAGIAYSKRPMLNRTCNDARACTLFICEGDSAMTLCDRGIKILGERYYGSFALRGKTLNVQKSSEKRYYDNVELRNLRSAIGLVDGKEYIDTKSLRYQRVVCCKDADYDGSSIMGLVINFFYKHFKSLLMLDDFFYEFVTPVVNVYRRPYVPSKSAPIAMYYSLIDFKRQAPDGYVKYIKGLGGNSDLDIKEYFTHFNDHLIHIDCLDAEEHMKLAYAKDMEDARKEMITKVNDESVLVRTPHQPITFNDFCDIDLALASYDTCERCIPSVVDGLKPSQRKVLYTFFKMSHKAASEPRKVFQLTGEVTSVAKYHHGDASLNDTITKMGQDFVGSNNIPLIARDGQFGSRAMLGKDNSAPRYIGGYLSPVTRLIFPEVDDDLLRLKTEDNELVEPIYYVPIIPMLLVNGANGIGTGWSSAVPMFNPELIIKNVIERLGHRPLTHHKPHANGYHGYVEVEEKKWVFYGHVEKIDSVTFAIDEIPLGMSINKLRERMNKLVESGVLVSYSNEGGSEDEPDSFRFILRFSQEGYECGNVYKDLKLSKGFSRMNLVAFDRNSTPKRYPDVRDMFDEWFDVRYKLYEERKSKVISELKHDIKILENKIRFAMNMKTYGIDKKSKESVISLLESEGYYKDNDSFSYLLSMPISKGTKTSIDKMIMKLNQLKHELDDYSQRSIEKIWIDELRQLLKTLREA